MVLSIAAGEAEAGGSLADPLMHPEGLWKERAFEDPIPNPSSVKEQDASALGATAGEPGGDDHLAALLLRRHGGRRALSALLPRKVVDDDADEEVDCEDVPNEHPRDGEERAARDPHRVRDPPDEV